MSVFYLGRYDVEEVSCRCVLLAKYITLLSLKQDIQSFDDEGAAAQSCGQTVLTEETPKFGLVLTDVL